METISQPTETPATDERLAYSVQEAADLLGVHYFSVYRLIQSGKLLVPRTELVRLPKSCKGEFMFKRNSQSTGAVVQVTVEKKGFKLPA